MPTYALSNEEILHIWERGVTQHPLDQALTLLGMVFPDQPRRALAQLSIGQRDGYLLDLYAYTFGPAVAGQAHCPACQHAVEFDFESTDIRVAVTEENAEAEWRLAEAGYQLTFRLSNSLDLAAIVQEHDPAQARLQLVERCTSNVTYNGDPICVERLPEAVLALLAAEMARHDPQAEIELALTCPTCGQAWPLLFDIVTFLWAKIDAQARRLLREVHLLAQAYSWREADILALSPARRQFYLEIVS